ncbi:MAG TPA: hypothetical protein VN226_06585 [Anaerolineales bacterium]|nr:hypothetical protein [Anaerolineales bacterium]
MNKPNPIKKLEWLPLLSLIFFSVLVMGANLTRGHVWGDDFAGYINQAQSIIEQRTDKLLEINKVMNTRSAIPPGPDAYPWGYPLLISPVIAAFGISPLAIKSINLLIWGLALPAMFWFARRKIDWYSSLLIIALCAFSPLFIQMSDLIQSDLPFLAACYWFLWKADDLKAGYKNAIVAGILLFFAIFFRTHGILLITFLLPGLIKHPSRKHAFSQLFVILATVGILYTLQRLIFPTGESSYISHFELFSWKNLWQNSVHYFWAFSDFFGNQPFAKWIFGLFFVAFLFAQKKAFQQDSGSQVFFYLTLLTFVVWPERQGARFLLPLILLFLIRTVEGAKIIIGTREWLYKPLIGAAALLTIFYLYGGVMSGIRNLNAERDISGPFDPYSYAAYEAIREETSPDDVIVFFKPRALYLFTERASFAQDSCDGLADGNFVLINKKQDNNLQLTPDSILDCPQVDSAAIFSNKRFVLYKLK